ncbi:MAG: 3-oxoacyl-[acyl-carrier-protein] reductase [Deltaproteobacteria bacterium]|nr:3-oxoacyl-[acyl-carrier-protein] reductase [Deltaproteobacteria bacterium]
MEETPTAVVSGGSRGIGRAIVIRLASQGYRVFFNHFDPDDGFCRQTEEAAPGSRGFRVNVADSAKVAEFFDTVVKEAGRCDVCVNNAGITRDGFLLRMKEADWDDVIAVNLKGVFNCLKHVGKIMMKQKSGSIVNIASVVGLTGNAGQANYSASKAGVIGLTKSAARELAGWNIRVNAVAPGFIETDMTAVLPDKVKDQFISQTPAKRMGTAEEVADAVMFLAGDQASFITGHILSVNGGLYM